MKGPQVINISQIHLTAKEAVAPISFFSHSSWNTYQLVINSGLLICKYQLGQKWPVPH